ncbi:hypothetical protein BST81_15090 [Leptolyngbya sp. 'hensonii']|uniref:TM2 domain-containing protein n=1 Tax=Leptolyngbya sp. 'hensonii' TaxID=1922337 RepID=UPI00094F86E3|nr:TM2 domain-containing protein [Leptolyngbya sp. 'hensonii']OLP17647.1 hypothetical protein BST81_15090 [Leptolyngbya sp. 'hensonii']
MATSVQTELSEQENRLTLSYILWLGGFVGLAGLHRFYNGKIGTGLLWLCTGGLFGIGQFVDLFLVPNMTEEHRLKLMLKYGVSPIGVPLTRPIVAAAVAQPSQQQQMVKLLQAARHHGGCLSVTQGVLATELSFTEVQALLNTMLKAGYAQVDNDPETGVVIYRFHEL